MKKLVVLIFGLIASVVTYAKDTGVSSVQDTAGPTSQTGVVSPQEAADLVGQKKAVIVDVREDDEWKAQHIPGAVHIPLGQLNNRLAELESYKQTRIITQCRSGKRSQKALETLKAAGFSNIDNMEGGLIAWNAAGLKTE